MAARKKSSAGLIFGLFKFLFVVAILSSAMIFSVLVPVRGLTLYQHAYAWAFGAPPPIDHVSAADQDALTALITNQTAKSKK